MVASVRLNTRTDSVTLTDAEFLIWGNDRMDEIAQAILKADENILLIPQKDDLVVNQREYSQPADILSRVTRVEAKLDETNFIELREKPITNVEHALEETEITNNYSNLKGGAFFYIARKAINILSGTIAAVTDGLRIWVDTWPTHMTDATSAVDLSVDPNTTTHGIPRALHGAMRMGIIIDYKSSREKPIPLTQHEQNYDKMLQDEIDTLKRAYMDRDTIGLIPSGVDRWNSGFDL